MIDRRSLVAAFGSAAIFVPGMAYAQSVPVNPNIAANPAPVDVPEPEHQTKTVAAGSLSLLASRLAVSRTRDAPLKQFAELEVAEQETMADVLLSLAGNLSTDGKVRVVSDADAQKNLDQAGRDALQKLRDTSGTAFDQAYLRLQIDGHEQLLQIQNNYLAVGTDAARLNVAKLAKGQIREHILLLASLDRDATVTGSVTPRTTVNPPAAMRR
jgi:putative membrane protein